MGRNLWIIALCITCGIARAQPRALDDVVHVSMVDGVLRIDADDTYRNDPRPMVLQGPESKWQFSISRAARVAAPQVLSLVRTAAGTQNPEDYWTISITAYDDQINIIAARAMRTPHATTLRLLQRGDKSVRVSVADGEKPQPADPITADATNLLALRGREPELVQQYIVPLLTQLCGEDVLLPGATDVYRAFYEIEPTKAAAAALQRVLPKLSAPSAEQREDASNELEQFGAPGVCAAERIDRSSLLPEAASRIDTYLDRFSRRRFDDPEAMRNDLSFLADCMDFPDDPRVRAAARARFEQLTGKPIPPADWSHAADYARGQIAAAANPARGSSRTSR